MQKKNDSRMQELAAITFACGVVLLTGCGLSGKTATAPATVVVGQHITGSVHGGQQPVTGATIQLYATGTGYGGTSYPLLTATVTSDSGGNFNITGDYACPTGAAQTYIVATGGNPGNANSVTNPNLSLMAVLGQCGSLSASTSIVINELTTVAAAYALAPFSTSYSAIGTTATNVAGLTNAVANAAKLVNFVSGTVVTPGIGITVPTAQLNTVADILASCVNSTGGAAGSSTNCGTLFTGATPPGGTAPTDTIGAALNIARYPANNYATLMGLASASAPFQPTTSGTDFTVAIKYKTGLFSTPSASSIDSAGNVWVTNAGNSTVSVLSTAGTPVANSPFLGGGLSGPSGVAIDASGNGCITDKTSSALTACTPSGTCTATSATSLSTPTAVAIDGQGIIWVTNSGSSSVTAVTASGTNVTASTPFSVAGVNTPVAVAINPH